MQNSPLPPNERLTSRSLLLELGLPALTILFGLQALRALLPGLVWGLSDAMGCSEALVGTVTILLFLTSLAAVMLRRHLGSPLLLIVSAGGLGLMRLLMQVFAAKPAVGLGLAMGGMVLFFLFVPAYLLNRRASGGSFTARFAPGLLLGLVLDTAVHGAFHTYDISWQSGPLPLAATLVPVLVQWALLAGFTLSRDADAGGEGSPADNRFVNPVALIATGPFLFLQVAVLQNIARVSALSGLTLPEAFGWTLLAQTAGLAAAVWLLSRPRRNLRPLAFIAGAGLVAVAAIPYPEGPVVNPALLFAGQVLSSLLIALAFAKGSKGTPQAMSFRVSMANAAGMLLLLVFLLGYYLSYYFSAPYSNTALEPLAAFAIAACALRSSGVRGEAPGTGRGVWLAVLPVLLLLALPLAQVISYRAPAAGAGTGYPVRIATYNIHNGFNTDGRLDMEAIALVIEECDADIIALQEVSRGWVINGRLDMLSWLSQRLDMPYVSGPTADPLWGNAILSRYPIVEYTEHALPSPGLPVKRGLLAAVIDLGSGESLEVIATHFHHIEEDSDVRQLQAAEAVDFWNRRGGAVLLGDLNAQPGDPEILMLRESGLLDSGATIEPPLRYTWPSDDPRLRIDYIWVSPDLQVRDVRVLSSTASDHLPVVCEVDLRSPADME